MFATKCNNPEGLMDGFSLLDKFVFRVSVYGFVTIGAYGIFLESTAWAIVYSAFAILGNFFVTGYCLCAHCPYPYKKSDCLFFPYQLITNLYEYFIIQFVRK